MEGLQEFRGTVGRRVAGVKGVFHDKNHQQITNREDYEEEHIAAAAGIGTGNNYYQK